jgi:hypothetical protein
MKNKLLTEIKNLEQVIYISELEKVSDKTMTNLRNKLTKLQKQAEND